ncbi:Ferrous-iron efflux pump FieF [Flavobacteriales bacterium]|nr:MAG: cation diffusion facilitator family transporter [Vicingaceae bacterium]CAG0973435.1 Ferrous-iron efflux pump FieF [Flavobacteriales bacterium]
MESSNIKIRTLTITLFISIALCIAKFAAYFITSSNAILSDALESIINVVAGGFALYSIQLASRPKDQSHPYGHGKIEFLSAGMEGGLIAFAGIAIAIKAAYNFFIPNPLQELEFGIIVSGIAGFINLLAGLYLQKTGKKQNSIALIADGKHLAADAYTSAGLIIGLVLIYITHIEWLDNLLALVFGILILYEGYKLIRKSVAGVMDEADVNLINEMIKTSEQNKKTEWIDLHNFRVIKYGADLHIDCHITLPFYFSLNEAHAEVEAFEKLMQTQYNTIELFVHADPCLPGDFCKICNLQNCSYRKESFCKNIVWTVENVAIDKHHEI